MPDEIEIALKTFLGSDGWTELLAEERREPGAIAAARIDMRRALEVAEEAKQIQGAR